MTTIRYKNVVMESRASPPGHPKTKHEKHPQFHRQPPRSRQEKPGTGGPLHTKEPVTVASFRTWRGWRENVARDPCPHSQPIQTVPKTGMAADSASGIRL